MKKIISTLFLMILFISCKTNIKQTTSPIIQEKNQTQKTTKSISGVWNLVKVERNKQNIRINKAVFHFKNNGIFTTLIFSKGMPFIIPGTWKKTNFGITTFSANYKIPNVRSFTVSQYDIENLSEKKLTLSKGNEIFFLERSKIQYFPDSVSRNDFLGKWEALYATRKGKTILVKNTKIHGMTLDFLANNQSIQTMISPSGKIITKGSFNLQKNTFISVQNQRKSLEYIYYFYNGFIILHNPGSDSIICLKKTK